MLIFEHSGLVHALLFGSFVASNWKHGWMGAFMWDVLQSLSLDQDIIACTQANFSSATDPKNATSLYHGASAFTRCVWEVKLGNMVLHPPHTVI